jgi:hypothetical protein
VVRVFAGINWSVNSLELVEVGPLVPGITEIFEDVGVPVEFLPAAAFEVILDDPILSFVFSFCDDDSIPPDKRTVASCSKLNAHVIWKLFAMLTPLSLKM